VDPLEIMFSLFFVVIIGLLACVDGHIAIWHPSMFGFNVTASTFPYDNRPVAPLADYTFSQWWFHGHLGYPPHPGDVFELPAGQTATAELGCNKGATSYYASSEGGDIRQGNNPCPNSPISAFHTTGFNDLKGCALAIAYKSDVSQVTPADFAVFSVNHACVWTRFTDFPVPARMPQCPAGGCLCAFFWIHSPDSGSEQNYMNGFRCDVTGSTSNSPVAPAQVPRRCGADPSNQVPNPTPGNCTYGAKQPLYWFQKEQNNMFEGTYSPPFYNDLYNFQDGAQNDIFVDSYTSIPPPSVNQTIIPTPVSNPTAAGAGASTPTSSTSVTSLPAQNFGICKSPSFNNNQKRHSAFSSLLRRKKRASFSLWHMF